MKELKEKLKPITGLFLLTGLLLATITTGAIESDGQPIGIIVCGGTCMLMFLIVFLIGGETE